MSVLGWRAAAAWRRQRTSSFSPSQAVADRDDSLVVVDQFEEVLTQAPPSHRAHFAALLRSGLNGPVQLIATLRPEFLERLLVDPELGALPKRVHTVEPLRRAALRTVIESGRLGWIEIDDGLVDRLVADSDRGEALPLLAYTLSQLADGVERGGRLLASRYQQLGGVGGALILQADAALSAAVIATAGALKRRWSGNC